MHLFAAAVATLVYGAAVRVCIRPGRRTSTRPTRIRDEVAVGTPISSLDDDVIAFFEISADGDAHEVGVSRA